MTLGRRRRQRGQALLLVLVFLAAFLILIWAGLRLASSAFLGISGLQADTRTTYALDAGLAYGMERINLAGNNCASSNPPNLTLAYPSGNITVAVTVTAAAGCTYDLRATASGTSRVARAHVDTNQNGNNNPLEIVWELYQ